MKHARLLWLLLCVLLARGDARTAMRMPLTMPGPMGMSLPQGVAVPLPSLHGLKPILNATRLAAAGACAGGFTNLILFPIDTAKSLRQSDPVKFPKSLIKTLSIQAREHGFFSIWRGILPAVLGSMPSSALYFGVYEAMKRRMSPQPMSEEELAQKDAAFLRARLLRRWGAHALAAASGNTASSIVFVPKEVVKQQLQTYRGSGGTAKSTIDVLRTILQRQGIRGLYSGYRATLLRNVPSAILRFGLYEEFKLLLQTDPRLSAWMQAHNGHLLAGALAGAISSALTTPLDVVKTRMAINTCPPGNVVNCLVSVAEKEGLPGLFTGLGFRMTYSALFTAVGFASFEFSKGLVGVKDEPPPVPPQGKPRRK